MPGGCFPQESRLVWRAGTEMYSLNDYGAMNADAGRFEAYSRAIAAAVKPGDVFVEIGCGPGVFSLLACQAGARRVFAIEMEECIQVARQLAAANGFADRIEFFQGDSRSVVLPERANVVLSDIRGTLPLYGHAIASLNDARERFLAPGGVLIPACDTLKAAVAEAEAFYTRLVSPWQCSPHGLDLSSSLTSVLNQSYGPPLQKEQLLTEPRTWGVLDYMAGAAKRVEAALNFQVLRSGVAHGLVLWFDARLLGDIGFSSGPGGSATIYGHVFLPWLQPVALGEGEHVLVALDASHVAGDYVWRWETQIAPAHGRPAIHFRQSTLEGAIFSPPSLRRRSADYVPQLTQEGQAHLWLLSAMNGKLSLAEIAREAAARFPTLFPEWQQAFECAIELAAKFAR